MPCRARKYTIDFLFRTCYSLDIWNSGKTVSGQCHILLFRGHLSVAKHDKEDMFFALLPLVLAVKKRKPAFLPLRPGINPLSAGYFLPLDYSWSGAPRDFTILHSQLKGGLENRGCFAQGRIQTCYAEMRRSLHVIFNPWKPPMLAAMDIGNINSLEISKVLRQGLGPSLSTELCSNEGLDIFPAAEKRKFMYAQVYVLILLDTQDTYDRRSPVHSNRTIRIPLRLPSGKCDVVFGPTMWSFLIYQT